MPLGDSWMFHSNSHNFVKTQNLWGLRLLTSRGVALDPTRGPMTAHGPMSTGESASNSQAPLSPLSPYVAVPLRRYVVTPSALTFWKSIAATGQRSSFQIFVSLFYLKGKCVFVLVGRRTLLWSATAYPLNLSQIFHAFLSLQHTQGTLLLGRACLRHLSLLTVCIWGNYKRDFGQVCLYPLKFCHIPSRVFKALHTWRDDSM